LTTAIRPNKQTQNASNYHPFTKKIPPEHHPEGEPFYRNLYKMRGIRAIPTIIPIMVKPTGSRTPAFAVIPSTIGVNIASVTTTIVFLLSTTNQRNRRVVSI